MIRKLSLLFMLFVVLVMYSPSISYVAGAPSTQTSAIVVSSDVDIWEESPYNKRGGEYYLFVGSHGGNRTRTLLYFDLSRVPRGSNIISAELHLTFSDYAYSLVSPPEVTIRAYRLASGFDESCADWYDGTCTELWSTPGGDYVMPPISSVLVRDKQECDGVAIDVKEYVDYVVNQGGPNHGLILTADDSKGLAYFYSREFGRKGPCVSHVSEPRPHLLVRYTPPSTASPSPPAPGPTYGINLIQPTGGELLRAGQTYQIVWETTLSGENADLYFSPNAGATWTFIECLKNTGGAMTYDWQVPSIESNQCMLRVRLVKACEPMPHVYDSATSGTFTITVQPLTGQPLPHEAPDFVLEINPPSANVGTGSSVSFLMTVEPISGSPTTVSLSVAGLSSDFKWKFDPPSFTPPGSSTLTIDVGEKPGTYNFVVAATANGVTKKAEGSITVTGGKRCIIATVTYGGELSDEVQLLRGFRDKMVMRSSLGRSFMEAFNAFYYSWSPQVAEKIDESPVLKTYMKYTIYPLIYTLRVCQWIFQPLVSLNVEIGVLLMGIVSSAILGMIYLGPVLYLINLAGVLRVSSRKLRYAALCFALSFVLVMLSYLTISMAAMMISISMLVLSSISLGGMVAAIMMGLALRRLSPSFFNSNRQRSNERSHLYRGTYV